MKKKIVERIIKLATNVNYFQTEESENSNAMERFREACLISNMWEKNFCKKVIIMDINFYKVEKLIFREESDYEAYKWNGDEFKKEG